MTDCRYGDKNLWDAALVRYQIHSGDGMCTRFVHYSNSLRTLDLYRS